jgi:hypothetical protein
MRLQAGDRSAGFVFAAQYDRIRHVDPLVMDPYLVMIAYNARFIGPAIGNRTASVTGPWLLQALVPVPHSRIDWLVGGWGGIRRDRGDEYKIASEQRHAT